MATEEEIRRVASVIEKADTEIIQCDYDDMARAAISEMRAIEREKAEESVESDEFDNYVANARYGREYLTKSGT